MILGYTRCSTEEQAAEGKTTLEEQARKIAGAAMMRGADKMDVVMYSDPGVSGAIPLGQRPSGIRMIDAARQGDIIIVAKLDRIFRSASDALITAEALQKRGIDIILLDIHTDPVSHNGVGKLFFTLLSAFAEFERGRIAERMTDGRNAKKRLNGCVGNVPYGYRKVGIGRTAVLEPDERERETITAASKLMKQFPPSEAARRINAAGFRTRAGTPFQIVQLQRITGSYA